MKEIELTKGFSATIDDDDFDRVNLHSWCVRSVRTSQYATTWVRKGDKASTIDLHRFILKLIDPKLFVDHIDHNGLNCTKSNLRICTNKQNLHNRLPNKRSTSQYKGVSWDKTGKKYRAQIKISTGIKFLGYFVDEIEAAKTYDKFAKKHFGEFAYLNFN